jgi:hypothetical protein
VEVLRGAQERGIRAERHALLGGVLEAGLVEGAEDEHHGVRQHGAGLLQVGPGDGAILGVVVPGPHTAGMEVGGGADDDPGVAGAVPWQARPDHVR